MLWVGDAPPANAAGKCVLWIGGISVGQPPTGETPLQHWQRAKANWEAANRYEDQAKEKLDELTTGRVIEDYMAAEKELESAKCKDVCQPGASK